MPHIDGDMTEYNSKNVNAHRTNQGFSLITFECEVEKLLSTGNNFTGKQRINHTYHW